jgi:DNA-binding LacI/PurR family transcriptional regulator
MPTKRPPTSITLSAISRAAGVTVTAVSAFYKKAYVGSGGQGGGRTVGISRETQARILEASRKLGYRPADPALRLRLYPEEGDICFLLTSTIRDGLANTYFARFANGAMSRLHRTGRHLAFAYFEPDIDYTKQPELLPPPLRDHQASRFIIASRENLSLLDVLADRGLPTVYLSRIVHHQFPLCLTPDYHAAPRVALTHLRALGHERIAIAASSYMQGVSYGTAELTRGVADAWRELFPGQPVPGTLFGEPFTTEMKGSLWAQVAALRPRPTAVYCFDDYAAGHVIARAQLAGLKVPADLSVVGTNNQLDAERLALPLTTVDLVGEEIGAAAVDELGRMVTSAKGVARRHRVFPIQLVTRQSTGPA